MCVFVCVGMGGGTGHDNVITCSDISSLKTRKQLGLIVQYFCFLASSMKGHDIFFFFLRNFFHVVLLLFCFYLLK